MWRKGICGGKAFTAETQRLETKDEGHRGNSHLTGDVVRRGKNAVRSMATANLVRTARREWLDWNPLQGTIRSYTAGFVRGKVNRVVRLPGDLGHRADCADRPCDQQTSDSSNWRA